MKILAGHKCTQEVEIQKLKDGQKYLNKTVNGNGEDGIKQDLKHITKKMSEMMDMVLKMKYYTHIKNWILGSVITLLFGFLMFVLGNQPIQIIP